MDTTNISLNKMLSILDSLEHKIFNKRNYFWFKEVIIYCLSLRTPDVLTNTPDIFEQEINCLSSRTILLLLVIKFPCWCGFVIACVR